MSLIARSFTSRASRAINAHPHELKPALAGFMLMLCLFAGYFMLRPVRDAMGIQAGVEHLQWLFTATFIGMLVAVPLFAWLNSVVPRTRFIDWVYAVFASHLLLFALAFGGLADNLWLARTFYVWISVYNLFVVSVAWSLMADVFDSQQARRLFAFIAAGASVGGLLGPLLSVWLGAGLGPAGLALASALLLGLALWLKHCLMAWRERGGAGRPGAPAGEHPRRPVAGNPFSGVLRVVRSRYLSMVCVFVVLLATTSTFLYFEQARLIAARFPTRAEQIRVFGLIDFAVQAGALTAQLFITSRIAQRFGVTSLLVAVPLVVAMGFVALALAPSFALLAGVMIARRIGEYAFIRPGREMLFAPLDAESKYKAKNFIDTVVYRGGDAFAGWLKSALDALQHGAVWVPVIGALAAGTWALSGWYLGRGDTSGAGRPAEGAKGRVSADG
jgi:AAA family ATP:ADP antiporter